MISDDLYLEAERAGVIVDCNVSLPETKSVSVRTGGVMVIGIDDSAMRTRAEERTHLAHELGHCMTGAFYRIGAPYDNRGWCERIANAYAVKRLIDEDELRALIESRGGDISIWELAEYFDVTEKMMRFAVDYYYGVI